jgi:hypothetical protein
MSIQQQKIPQPVAAFLHGCLWKKLWIVKRSILRIEAFSPLANFHRF